MLSFLGDILFLGLPPPRPLDTEEFLETLKGFDSS